MDLLDKNNALDLADSSWKIYTQDTDALPQYIGAQASIERAFITQGCIVDGLVKNSVTVYRSKKVASGEQKLLTVY